MSDVTEQDMRTMQLGRLMRAEADVILPLLAERREQAITKMLQHYRAGKFEMLPSAVAELCVTEDMKQTIKNKIKAAEAVERKVMNEHDGE